MRVRFNWLLLALICQTAVAQREAIAPNVFEVLGDETRVHAFRHMDEYFPVKTVDCGETPFTFRESLRPLDVSFEWQGETQTLDAFLEKTTTTALLVIHDDAIVYERYWNGNDRASKATSMSVAKSFVSALVGFAIAEGKIGSVQDPVDHYVPELKKSGYAGVPIEHVLQMSSGIAFSEVYDDLETDINTLIAGLAQGVALKDYMAGLPSERQSGEAFNYASIDTSVLAWVVERAVGMPVTEYLEAKLWKPLGMEADATWCTDNHGTEIAFGFLNVTARDYAKFGRLYLNRGRWNEAQLLPEHWVEQSVTVTKPYLKLTDHYVPGWDIGYGYQWWVPAGDEGEFTGIGVWGQYLYVNPAQDVIIVKNSVDPGFDLRDQETMAAFRAIAAAVSGS